MCWSERGPSSSGEGQSSPICTSSFIYDYLPNSSINGGEAIPDDSTIDTAWPETRCGRSSRE